LVKSSKQENLVKLTGSILGLNLSYKKRSELTTNTQESYEIINFMYVNK